MGCKFVTSEIHRWILEVNVAHQTYGRYLTASVGQLGAKGHSIISTKKMVATDFMDFKANLAVYAVYQ